MVILDHLTLAKVLKLLESCAVDGKVRKLPIFFSVIGVNGFVGQQARVYPDLPLSFTGPYSDSQLMILIARERPDIIFFPALWPETYSFTLSYAMRSGLPIAAPRIGAFIERLADYPHTRILDWDTPAAGWNDMLMTFWREHDHDMTQEGAGDGA